MNSRLSIIIIAILFAAAGLAVGYMIANKQSLSGSPLDIPTGGAATTMTIVSIKETTSTSPAVTIEYPQFPSLPAALNDAIASATMSRLVAFKENAAETMKARAATGDASAILPASDYDFIASWEPAEINSRYVSFIERYDSYSGGANGNQDLQTFDYDISANRFMALSDLFPDVPDLMNKISGIARNQLIDSLTSTSNGNAPLSMIEAGTSPDPANFQNFTFTDDLVTIYFPKYAVAPGSFSEQHVTIVRSSVK